MARVTEEQRWLFCSVVPPDLCLCRHWLLVIKFYLLYLEMIRDVRKGSLCHYCCADNKNTDQFVHLCCLIRTFFLQLTESLVTKECVFEKKRLIADHI